jgi:hypothetical protein
MLDKVFLFLFGVEWFAFGVLGLFFPEFIIGLLGVYDYSLVFLNETRALYAFFTFVGLMSFIAIYRINFRKKVYLTYTIFLGSFVVGRLISFMLDGSFNTTTFYIFLNEIIVFAICFWRYSKRDFIF